MLKIVEVALEFERLQVLNVKVFMIAFYVSE
jgi:hypothetical protein